jgi:hypothetical protein
VNGSKYRQSAECIQNVSSQIKIKFQSSGGQMVRKKWRGGGGGAELNWIYIRFNSQILEIRRRSLRFHCKRSFPDQPNVRRRWEWMRISHVDDISRNIKSPFITRRYFRKGFQGRSAVQKYVYNALVQSRLRGSLERPATLAQKCKYCTGRILRDRYWCRFLPVLITVSQAVF